MLSGVSVWPGLVVLLVAGICGAPIFALLGGAAVVLFMADGQAPVAILIETYALSVSPTLPAIPLFTLAGFLLAEGRSSERLLRVFRAWFGWIPGGTAVVCALLCSFFTVFTGGSGVTILALGGVLFPALRREGYRERFSLGLLTASGSLGLLLPPALPLILYAVVAERPIEDLFIGGILPGVLLTTMIAGLGVREGLVTGVPRRVVQRRRGHTRRRGCQVGARASGDRPRVDLQRTGHAGRVRRAHRRLRAGRPDLHPPGLISSARPAARHDRVRRHRRRRARDPRRGRRAHELPGRSAGAVAAAGMDAGLRPFAGCSSCSG